MMVMNQKMRALSGGISKAQSRHFLPKVHHSVTLFSHNLRKLARVSGLPQIGEAISRIGRSASDSQSAVKKLLMTLTAPGLVISGVGFGLKSLLGYASSEAASMRELSHGLGVGIKRIQAFQFAAAKAGVSNEDLASSFTSLSRASLQASMGVGDSANIFQALGMSPMDKSGKKLKPTDQLFLELSSKLSAMKNAPLKREFATQLLGGTSLLPLMNQGRAGIESSLNQAQGMPFFIDEKQMDLNHKYQASLGTFVFLLRSIRNTLGSEILPVVTQVFSSLNNHIISSKDEMKQFFVNFSKGVPEGLKQARAALSFLGESFSSLVRVIRWLNDKVGISTIIIGLVGLKAASSALAVLNLAGSFGKLILFIGSYGIPTLITLTGVLAKCLIPLATNPLTLTIVALYRLVRVTQFVCEKFESFKELFSNAFSSPLEFLGKILTLIKTIGKAFVNTDWAASGLDDYLNEKRTLKLPSVPAIALKRGAIDIGKAQASMTNRPSVSKEEGGQDSKVTVRFENAPAGLRVREQKGFVQTEVNRGLSLLGVSP